MHILIYELLYRIPFVPIAWIFGPLFPDLVKLVESGRIEPGRAIDLGCGVGIEAIYLAESGFDVIGVDFSPTAIRRARRNARKAGVEVAFYQEDLTDLQQVNGTYDFLLDVGALSDMDQKQREGYVRNVLPLTHSGSIFLLMAFEARLGTAELERRFGEQFSIERISGRTEAVTSRSMAVHLLTRQ
jgi:cyclopropane fatty-acyl-phospholipid synthase-like methyltransferase